MNPNPALVQKTARYSTLEASIDKTNWSLDLKQAENGGSPFRGLSRQDSKALQPQLPIAILGEFDVVWTVP